MVGPLMFAPILIMKYSRGDEAVAVIDDDRADRPAAAKTTAAGVQTTDLDRCVPEELTDKFGVLYIGSDILTTPIT